MRCLDQSLKDRMYKGRGEMYRGPSVERQTRGDFADLRDFGAAVGPLQDLHVLRRLLAKREGVLRRLERAELRRRKLGKDRKIWTGPWLCLSRRVNSVDYLTEELNYYNTEVTGALESDSRAGEVDASVAMDLKLARG